LFVTTITQAEILYGVEALPAGRRREALQLETKAIFDVDFAGRILSFDQDAALAYPMIVIGRRAKGRPISPFDAQIAAIVQSRGAKIATRNVRDFEDCGIEIVNPWA
jgi:predicted nucleic acid-binding protein